MRKRFKLGLTVAALGMLILGIAQNAFASSCYACCDCWWPEYCVGCSSSCDISCGLSLDARCECGGGAHCNCVLPN